MSATKNFRTDLTAANRGALRSATALGRVLTVAAAATAMGAEGVKAGPKGGVVKAGSATITTRGGTTTINQAGQKVVIDWDSFDIDAKDAVNFLQPGKDSIALNRVLNDLPTNIRGQLTANGNVWIVNQHGVTFHAGAVVNVGSLIATTADISNADFMAGNYKFDKPGDPNARIINEGDITFGEAGLAAFVAPSAANRGVIAGRMGKVVIAGNETFAVDLAGDGMWAFTMGEGANGASAANSGRIHNPGGYILISARAAQGMVDSNISVGGVIEATTARVEGGKIVLSGDGFVEVAGSLDATGAEAGQVGGSIEITGEKVHVTATAKIDASGDAGGGSIKIGGDYQGGGALKTASRTLVSEGAEIAASAIGQVGDGGEVIVWADEITGFFGSIRATGGANAGDGGFAEVSGKQQLAFDGMVDLSARNGLPGTLLLDPDEIIISAVGTDDAQLADNQILFGDGGAYSTFNISTGTIETQLNAGTDVLLQANNSITLEASNPITATGAGNLTLNASSNGLYLNSDVTIAGDLSLTTGGVIAPAAGVTLSASDVALYVNGPLALGSITASGDLIVQSTLGGVSDTAGETVDVTGTTSITAARDILLDNATNVFGGTVSLSGEDVQLTGTSDLTLGAITANANGADTLIAGNGDVVLSGGAITFGGVLTGVDELMVTSTGAILQTAAITAADLATFNTNGGAVTLTQAGNAFGSIAVDTTFTGMTSADVSITEVDATALGVIDANALTVSSGGGITEVAGAVINADGATSLTTMSTIDLRIQDTHTFGGTVTLSGAQIVDFALAGSAVFGDITATNAANSENRITSSGGTVALNGTVSIAGTSDLYLRAGGLVVQSGTITADQLRFAGGSFLLTGANNVGSLNTPGGSVGLLTFNDANGVDLAGLNAFALTVTAGGAITDSATNTILGAASLTATDSDFTLDEAGNRFGALSLTGGNVSVLNLADLVLGAVDLSGALVVNVTGGVTQGATSVAVDGTTSIIAADDIALASALNEFAGVLTLSGEDISIANTATVTLTLGAITAADNTPEDTTLAGDGDVTVAGGAIQLNGALTSVDDLTVNAAGMISQGVAIAITGDLDVNAAGQTVSLNNGSNDFQSSVDVAAGSLYLNDANGLLLNDLDLTAYSTITAGTAITQTAATGASNAVDAAEVSLTASSGVINLGNTSNDFGSVKTSATGAVTLGDINGVILQSQDFTGSLTVNATGDITDDDNFSLTLSGPVYLSAGTGAITFDNDNLDFQGSVEASGASVTLDDDNNLMVDAITASTGAATLSADETLTINTGEAVQGASVALTANAVVNSGTITATGGGVDVDATTTVTSAGQINATTAAAVVDIDAGGAVQVAGIDAAGISITTTSGDITQTGGIIATTEASDFTATGSVTITGATNDFAGSVGLSGTQAAVRDANALELGDVSVATLTVNASGSVTQDAATSLTVTTSTSITTTDDILLANAANAVAGSLNLSGEDINLDAGGNVTLDAITASNTGGDTLIAGAGDVTISGGTVAFPSALTGVNDLDVIATGGVSQTAAITVGGALDVDATGQTIDLSNMANDFQGAVDADGQTVTLVDANSLTLGVVAAGGVLTVEAKGGDILDIAASSDISAVGAASFTASNNIQIDSDRTHSFSDGITLSANQIINFETDNSGARFDAITTSGANLINTIEVGAGLTDFAGDITLATGADLIMRLRGDLTQSAGRISADQLAVVSIGSDVDVTLERADNDLTSFRTSRQASVQFGDVSIVDTNELVLAGNLATDLTVQTGGAITQTGEAVVVGSATFTTTGDAVTLTQTDNDFTSISVDTTGGANAAANVQITDTNGLALGDISAASLTIIAGGDVTQVETTTISATGTTTLTVTGGGVALEDATNDFATVTGSANAIALRDANGVTLGTLTANVGAVEVLAAGDVIASTIDANTISVETTNGAINQTSGAITTADGAAISDFTATTSVTLDQAGNDFGGPVALSGQTVTIRDTDALVLDDVAATGTLIVNAGGTVSQNGASTVTVAETATFTATGQNIDLSNDNDFQSTFVATGADVKVTDTGAIELGAISASTLTVEAGGAVSQSAAATVANETTVTAAGQAVDLDNAANAFTGVVNVTGGAVEIINNGALGLGDITAASLIASTPTGDVSNAADDVLSVTGTTSITANTGAVTIASNAMNSEDLRQTVTIMAGGAISLTGVNSQKLVLGDVAATAAPITVNVSNQAIDLTGNVDAGGDTLTLRSAGDIIQQAGEIEASEVVASSSANAVTLETAGNKISALTLGANGAVSVVTSLDVAIGQEAMGGQSTLTLESLGDISQASSLTVTNNAGFITSGGSITLNAVGNAFGSVSADTSADMSMPDQVIINEADATIIRDITASSATVTSGGAITQTGVIDASASSSFTANGDVTLTNAANDFADAGSGYTAAFSGATVNVTDVDTLALGAVTSSASTTITADDAGASGAFSGGLTELRFFDTDGDMVLSSALVLPATVVNFTADSLGAIDAQSLTSTNANTLLDATTSVTFSTGAGSFASLTVNAPNGVYQTAPITVTGATDLNAPTSQIALGNSANDFQGRIDADASGVVLYDANDLELALINSDTLIANAGGDITDQGAKIEARNYASFTALDDIIIDTLDTHVFNSGVSLSADQITRFAAKGPFSFGAITATNAGNVTNRITVTGGFTLDGAVSTAGASDLTLDTTNANILQNSGTLTTDALTLNLVTSDGTFTAGANDINTLSASSATNVALTDTDGVTIATIDATTLTVTAGGEIDQQVMSTVTLTGLATFTTTGQNITLAEATNDFAVIDADGGDLTFRDANSVELADIDATGALSIVALGGDITDGASVATPAGADVDVAGTTTLTATGAITLDDATNDFGGAVAADGQAITLRDANSITLGDIDAGGALVVEAVAGAIMQNGEGQPGEDINAGLTSSFTASTTISLTDASNDFVGVVTADGVDVSLVDLNAIELADIDATNLNVTADSIDDGAPSMGVNADIDVTGIATLTARTGDVTLDDATNNFGVVNAAGATVTLTDRNAVELGDIDAATLVVTATSIDDGAAQMTTDADVNVIGTTTLTASTTITLDDATNDFGNVVTASGTTIILRDANSIILGDIDASDALTVDAVAGAITQNGDGAAGEDIDVTATATFTAAGAITLTDGSNDFKGTVNAAGEDVSLVDLNAIELADIDATTLTVTAATIDDGAAGVTGGDVNVTATTSLTASTTITLDDATNDFGGSVSASGTTITLRDANSIVLGDIDAGGALTVEAVSGDITQNGDGAVGEDIDAMAAATFTATGAITLTDASNDFSDIVNAAGEGVSLVDLNAIELADIDATSLTVNAASIDDGAAGAVGEDINVSTTTNLTASTTITLDDATNDFSGAVLASGTTITLRDANSIILGDIDAGSVLTVDAVTGAISQNGDGASGEDINAAAEANFTAATTITLTDASNDFVGLVNADGTDVAIRSLGELQLGDIDSTSLDARAAVITDGATSIVAGSDINVSGATTLNAGTILLNDATHDFGQAVSFDGQYVTLTDINNIVLGEGVVGETLDVSAAGSITDSSGSAISVEGATTLTAQDGVATFDIALDNDTAADRHDFRGAVNAVGQDITLIDRSGITLGTITTNGGAPDDTINVDGGAETADPGELIVIARGGAITQQAATALTVTGDTTLEAADGVGGYFDITLTNTANAFDSDNTDAVGDGDAQVDVVTFLGETVAITDTGPFFVFDSVANAGGVLTAQTGDLTIEQLRVNAGNGPLVGIALNGAIDADDLSGGSITLGGAGSTDGAATAATGVVTVDDFSVDALAVASDISTTLTNGDAGAGLEVAAPLQTFTFVKADAFTDGVATDFNAVTGSTADQLILERIAFDGDITIAAGDVDLGHIDADDGLFVTALTGDVTKRADADLDFAGSTATGFTVAGARGAADQTVTLQSFDTLLRVGGAASFTATSGDVVITRGQTGSSAKEVDLQGPVSIAATDAAIEDRSGLVLGQVAVDNNLAIRINTDNANAAAETLTQTATQTITVGGDLAVITGVGGADRSDVTLTTAGNSFNTVNALAGNLSIRGGDAFALSNSDLTGDLTIGSATAQHGGDLTLQDVQLDGNLALDATGATTLSRLDIAGATGVAGSLTVTDLRADAVVNLTTTGGDLTVTDAIIGAFDFDSAGALTVTNLSTAGSDAGLSTAVGDINVANIVSASNASFDSSGGTLDIDSARIGSTLTLSASGNVTLGAISTGADLTATSDTASVLIRDAATEAPADIVVDGVQAATIGFESGPLVGDIADNRVIEATTGTAGQTIDPADFTLQLAIGGDAAFDAAGSILLPREAAAEGGLQNDFMGDVALSSTTGNVVIEDANALSFATVTITTGDLSARSNADNTGAGEGITQTAAIAVGGTASFITGDHGGAAIADEAILADVTLGSAMNDFTGAVSVVADNATLADANAIAVANARVAGALLIDTTSAGASDITALTDAQSGGATTVTSGGAVDLDRVSVGGALIATGQGAGLTANDVAVTGRATLTAATTIAIDDALLADATITAGASGALSDVSAQVINVQTGGVTISGLSATTTTITSTGAADIEQISTSATTITVAGNTLALSQAEIAGPLTARAGTGAIRLADVNVAGDAIIDGGAISSDASGGGETRLRVAGALDLDGADVDLTDVLILGAAALDAAGTVTLDDASFTDLTVNADGTLTITDAGATATTLSAGGALSVTNMRIGTLDADAGGAATFEAVQITGAADILSSGDDVRLGSVQVGDTLDAEATAGSVTTFAGTNTLGEVTVSAPVAIALPAFTVEGPAAAAIGVEAALANSPTAETRVVDVVIAAVAQANPAISGDQASDATLAAAENTRTLAVAGTTTITASNDLTLNDADLADATLTAGDAGTLTSVVAATLSVSTGGTLTTSGLSAGNTTITSGGPTDLEDIATASATITVADANLNARRVETDGSLTIDTGAGDIALADLNVTGGAAISGATIGSDASGAGETRVAVGGALDVDATGDVALTDLSVTGATDVSAGGAVSLGDISLAAANVTAGGDLSLTDGQIAAVTLDSGGALNGSNLRAGSLDAAAAGDVTFDAMRIEGDAAILSTGGDIGLGSVAVSGQLTAESADGAIRTIDSDFALGPVIVTAATPATVPAFGAGTTTAAASILIGEETNSNLVSVGGDAYFKAAGDIALVDDAVGVTGNNDFMGGVTAISGGSVILNDANDLLIGSPTGVAAPGGGAFASTGITATESLRVDVGGAITDADAPQAALTIGRDVLLVAGGDILLDNETHDIGGVVAADGQNITLTETGTINLGRINASGDLMVEAGANNAARGGTLGDAAIIQTRGAISVDGASTFATGLDLRLAIDAPQPTAARNLVLDNPANNFVGDLRIARISGDATITENSQDGAVTGEQRIANFEIGGTTRLTTTDNITFIGQLTALLDDAEVVPQVARPVDVEARSQGDLNIADADLRLFIATGEQLIIDTTVGAVDSDGVILTTANQVNPIGANVRFDRPIDGDNTFAPEGSASIADDRKNLGGLTINAGNNGIIRFRNFVGALHPLGDVSLSGGDIIAGITFAERRLEQPLVDFSLDTRFLFNRDPLKQDDFFFARNLDVKAQRRIEFLTPFRTVENFILLDQYFGVNIASLVFGGLKISDRLVGPEFVQSFGFIGNDRSRATGLFPRGPQGGNFQFNDCVIGDVADCTNIPIPNVVNNILTPAPPLLGIDTEDLLELFGSFGNEELWGVPQSYYSDLGEGQENKPNCPEGSADADCDGS